MIELIIKQIEFTENGYRIHWYADDKKDLFSISPLEISFDFQPSQNLIYPVNNFLAFTLPVLANEYKKVKVVTDYSLADRVQDYWQQALHALNIENFDILWQDRNTSRNYDAKSTETTATQQHIGLLFGGGVESTFALSKLYSRKPILISVISQGWMNNNLPVYTVKRNLEDELVSAFGLQLQRVTSNAFSLLKKPDLYKNYYTTGFLFYWHSLPICRQFSVHTVYKASELEEALNFEGQDLSLHPRFLKNIEFGNEPLFLPLYNCYSKIQMLAELAKTPFIKYIYSCLNNTDRKWCGQCSKCYRISEFCHRLGIEKALIGMPEGFIGLRETGPISRNYWQIMDRLYGRRYFRELLHYLKYHSKKNRNYS